MMLAELSEIPEYHPSSSVTGGNVASPRVSVLLLASSVTSSSPTTLETVLLWAQFPQAANYFQNGEYSSLNVGNICPGWEEPWEIMVKEGGEGRTAKISPVGRLDAEQGD